MTQSLHRNQTTESVDQLVDRLLEETGLADDIKSKVRKHLAKASVVNLSKAPRATAAWQDDDDDMWDNVPV